MSMTTCPACGAAVTEDQRFCGDCGTRLAIHTATPQENTNATDRSAVLHRPGGGTPDPFAVGTTDNFNDDDDFFSQFTPKSQRPDTPGSSPAAARPPRRRFNPNIYETGPVEDIEAAQRERAANTWRINPERQPKPNEATFTQLIEGLPNDPADRPIESPKYVQEEAAGTHTSAAEAEESSIAPLPEPEIDPAQQAQQERANAFFTDAPSTQREMPALPQLEQPQEPEPATQAFPPVEPKPAAAQPPAAERELSFEGLMSEFNWDEQSAKNQQDSPASTRDWRAADHRAAQAAANIGAGTTIPTADDAPLHKTQRFTAAEVQRRRRGVTVIFAAALLAIAVVLGAFGIHSLLGGNAPSPNGSAQTVAAPETTAAPESSPAPAAPATPAFQPVTFQSASGNIRCQITSETGVACQLTSTAFVAPEQMCQSGDFSGAAVGVSSAGVTYPCLTEDLNRAEELEYDTPVTAGTYTCSINYTTGVSCDNGQGDGFSLEYREGITPRGKTASPAEPSISPVQ